MWRFDRQAILQDRFTRSGAMISSNVSGTPMVVPSSTRAPWSDISRITQSSTDNPLLKISLPPLNVRRRIWDLRSFMRRLTFAASWNVHGHAPLGQGARTKAPATPTSLTGNGSRRWVPHKPGSLIQTKRLKNSYSAEAAIYDEKI